MSEEPPLPRIRNSAARVKWRLKGAVDGPVYEGQREVIPCKNCGQKSKSLRVALTDSSTELADRSSAAGS